LAASVKDRPMVLTSCNYEMQNFSLIHISISNQQNAQMRMTVHLK